MRYPTARLFRQPAIEGRAGVTGAVREALRAMTATAGSESAMVRD